MTQVKDETKFSAYIPNELYLQFTQKAREKSFKENGETRGCIKNAVIDAIKLWVNQEGGN